MKNILITGGAGFVGSHLIKFFIEKYPNYNIYNIDKLTYAGNLKNLKSIENARNYEFIKGDILDTNLVEKIFEQKKINHLIHLAAESHVDKSIQSPDNFVRTNVFGTVNLLNNAVKFWNKKQGLFYMVSTDEVYGSLRMTDKPFTEVVKYNPKSPYAASKASADHFVKAYNNTFGLKTIISNCSNNYGTHQYPEKLIPLVIKNIKKRKKIPVYGTGQNIRDWVWVKDHVKAIDLLFHQGKDGNSYNIGGNNEMKNIDMVRLLCRIAAEEMNVKKEEIQKLITFVKDRPGHDLRYAVNFSKIKKEFQWNPIIDFEKELKNTVKWFLNYLN